MWPATEDEPTATAIDQLRTDMNGHFAAVRGRLPLVDPETANALADQRIRELEQQLAESRELAATRHNRLTAAEARLQAVTEERDRLWAAFYAAWPGRQATASATACEFLPHRTQLFHALSESRQSLITLGTALHSNACGRSHCSASCSRHPNPPSGATDDPKPCSRER